MLHVAIALALPHGGQAEVELLDVGVLGQPCLLYTSVLDGPAATLAQNADIKEFYLGLTAVGERKSYRDVKHYKRRKRWLG